MIIDSMSLREFIHKNFGVNLPISGGYGDTQDNAIIIHSTSANVHIQIEYKIIRCFARHARAKYRFIQQTLLQEFDGKVFDKIDIEVRVGDDYSTRQFYFDITECFASVPVMFRA